MGADAVQPSDAASMLEPRVLLSDFMSEQNTVNADSYTFPANLDHDEVMAEIVNQGELAVKRQGLYQELAEFYELSVVDRTRALRHLNRDDGDATTYFQLLTMEEKRTFVSILLE
ncbi:hypothetical protein LINPERPRIM_LOCUS32012 [Linum perenne]